MRSFSQAKRWRSVCFRAACDFVCVSLTCLSVVLTCLSVVCWSQPPSNPQTQTTDIRPLAELIDTPVAPVASRSAVRVPVITWGSDIATLYANGNTALTQPGSLFSSLGLNLELIQTNSIIEQLQSYISGDSPFLRCTIGMCAHAFELLSKDPRTRPVVIAQLSWSAGGDVLVGRGGIESVADLKGKTIALQAYGPHVHYLMKLLDDYRLTASDVRLVWLDNLTGESGSPRQVFERGEADAAFVIVPDALLLTSNGTVGNGVSGSVKGASILVSTKTASRIIADVYVVRADYLAEHRSKVERFVNGLFRAQEQVKEIMAKPSRSRRDLLTATGAYFLGRKDAISKSASLYNDMLFTSYRENVQFFEDPQFPRGLARLVDETQRQLKTLNLVTRKIAVSHANWDYGRLLAGLYDKGEKIPNDIDHSIMDILVRKLDLMVFEQRDELYSLEALFGVNDIETDFQRLDRQFQRTVDLMSTYGGALIVVEGHSDPTQYLQLHQHGADEKKLNALWNEAISLSEQRAIALRNAIAKYARSQRTPLNINRFVVKGYGFSQPKSGLCGERLPCAPPSERAWKENRRAVLRIYQKSIDAALEFNFSQKVESQRFIDF